MHKHIALQKYLSHHHHYHPPISYSWGSGNLQASVERNIDHKYIRFNTVVLEN
jgi:hypothetical protein